MQRWTFLFVALSAPLASACFQELDTRAASESGNSPNQTQTTSSIADCEKEGKILGGGGQCLDPDNSTPRVDLGDGTDTDDPCVRTLARSVEIRTTYCAGCHTAATASFGAILDDEELMKTVSRTQKNDAGMFQSLIVPGKPEESRLYQRVRNGEMPPEAPDGVKQNPIPTISDISTLRSWILCLGGDGAWGTDTTPLPADDAGAPAEDDGGSPSDDGSMPMPDARPPADAGAVTDARTDARG